MKRKALERLQAAQDTAIDRLMALMLDERFPSTSYAAVRDILDRTMGRPKETVDMTVTGELAMVQTRLEAIRKRKAQESR